MTPKAQAPKLSAISNNEQAEHSLQDKQKAVQQELKFLIRDFKAVGQLQSPLFLEESIQVFAIAVEALLKNKLNFDTEKYRQQQGALSVAEKDLFIKQLNQCLTLTHRNWLKPALSQHCLGTENSKWLRLALDKLDQRLMGLKAQFGAWVEAKTKEAE